MRQEVHSKDDDAYRNERFVILREKDEGCRAMVMRYEERLNYRDKEVES